MEPVIVTCRKSDVRRVRISCRCGNVFIAEVPQEIARSKTLHPCSGCSAAFVVTQTQEGKWLVKRVSDRIEDMVFAPNDLEQEPPKKEDRFVIGLRIKIIDVSRQTKTFGSQQMQLVNPHPEHVGKFGTIIGEEDCGSGLSTPRIRLDDGTVLTGAECWWEPVAM